MYELYKCVMFSVLYNTIFWEVGERVVEAKFIEEGFAKDNDLEICSNDPTL